MSLKDTLEEANHAPRQPPALWWVKFRSFVDSFLPDESVNLPRLFQSRR